MVALSRRRMLATIMLAASGCASEPGTRDAVSDIAVRDRAWDAVFTRVASWNGGDIAHSIDLVDGRTLWLFGDSIFGPVRAGRRVGDESRMLRAGVAWHPTPKAGGVPRAASVEFAAPERFAGAAAASWASPAPGLFADGTWYWLMNDGVRLNAPRDRLVIFATAMGPSGNPDGAWNFRRLGGAVICIDNPADPPDRWVGAQTVNPLVTPSPRFGEASTGDENHGLAIVQWPPGSSNYAIFGARTKADGSRHLIVMSSSGDLLASPSRWLRVTQDAAVDPPRVPDEFTIEPVVVAGRTRLVLIYSEPFANRSIWARTANAPHGPWSEPIRVHDCENDGPDVVAYAAKGHAALSRPGELLVTYVSNSNLERVAADLSIYRPRFIRVPLALLPEPPAAGLDASPPTEK